MSALAPVLQGFFTERLTQRQASPHTVASYRDTFCLLLRFAQQHLGNRRRSSISPTSTPPSSGRSSTTSKPSAATPPRPDCGGIWGYADLMEVLADTTHPEHEDKLKWLGLDDAAQFDPAGFDAEEVTKALSHLH